MNLSHCIRLTAGATFGLALAAFAIVAGCASPSEQIDRTAATAGFTKHIVNGDLFDHLILTRNLDGTPPGSRLHVYIEGDGTAWIANRWIAEDPTPVNPVALALMRVDPGPVLYLGRPCYFRLQRNCTSDLWTAGRYSEKVVRSMADTLNEFLGEAGHSGSITLIGYSGGGTLAMLLASRIADVDSLITLAANLDVERWTRHHGYGVLTTSLDPARLPPLPRQIRQFHLVGGSDKNVPPDIVQDAVDRQPNAELLLYPEFTHDCCWPEVWPVILGRISPD